MQLGMIGLGRMGANMVRRLMRAGHTCVVYDVNADAVKALEEEGATGAASLEEFVAKLDAPESGVGHGARRVHRRHGDQSWPPSCPPTTSSSTAGIPTTSTTLLTPPS